MKQWVLVGVVVALLAARAVGAQGRKPMQFGPAPEGMERAQIKVAVVYGDAWDISLVGAEPLVVSVPPKAVFKIEDLLTGRILWKVRGRGQWMKVPASVREFKIPAGATVRFVFQNARPTAKTMPQVAAVGEKAKRHAPPARPQPAMPNTAIQIS